MNGLIWLGILIPLFGTAAGAVCVLLCKGELNRNFQRAMAGLAAGVMVAASVWSLLLPAIERSESFGRLAFLPAAGGFAIGFFGLLFLDHALPSSVSEPVNLGDGQRRKTYLTSLAVTLHNLPEGMAVGVAFAALLAGEGMIEESAAMALSIGIAIQNIPEGAIISMPLHGSGMSKGKALGMGILSGIVEPLGAGLTLLCAVLITPALPWFLSFAAGAMLFVVVEELIPEMADGPKTKIGAVSFAVGFLLMMILDVTLG